MTDINEITNKYLGEALSGDQKSMLKDQDVILDAIMDMTDKSEIKKISQMIKDFKSKYPGHGADLTKLLDKEARGL
jgi:hypothetical protein